MQAPAHIATGQALARPAVASQVYSCACAAAAAVSPSGPAALLPPSHLFVVVQHLPAADWGVVADLLSKHSAATRKHALQRLTLKEGVAAAAAAAAAQVSRTHVLHQSRCRIIAACQEYCS
jgi:hypothetical protein